MANNSSGYPIMQALPYVRLYPNRHGRRFRKRHLYSLRAVRGAGRCDNDIACILAESHTGWVGRDREIRRRRATRRRQSNPRLFSRRRPLSDLHRRQLPIFRI